MNTDPGKEVVEVVNASVGPEVDHRQTLEAAIKAGLFRESEIRPSVKLRNDAAKIAIAIPIGDKDDPDMYQCPHCERRQIPETIKCSNCGGDIGTGFKLRTSGLVPIEFLMAMWQVVPPLLVSMSVMVRKGILSAQAREEMTLAAIEQGVKYIFYVDDDVLIPNKTLYDLHNQMEKNPNLGAITGVYTTREDCPEPLIYKEQGQGACWDFSTKRDVTEPIMASGAGCLLARVECLKEVKDILGGPWWSDVHEFERGGGRSMWGHDVRFCRRIWLAGEDSKASRKWEVHVAGWLQCYHYDCREQKLYSMPKDAPCFKNANTAGYWDKVWSVDRQEDEFRSSGVYMPLYRAVAENVPQYADVIDVGSGPGMLMEILARLRQAKCMGVDLSQWAVDQLKERMFEAELCDVKDWKYGRINGGEKDPIVVCTETMEHMTDEQMAHFIEESAKAPRTIITVPEGELEGTPPGEHLQVFTVESLEGALKPHFKSVSVVKVPRSDTTNFLLAVCDRGE
jgi:hypothetical protein